MSDMTDTTTTDPNERMTAAGADQCREHDDCVGGLDHAGECTDANGDSLGSSNVPATVEKEVAALEAAIAVVPEASITPELSELTRMAQLATTFAHAHLVPKDLQGRPADVLLVMMTARSLGLDYPTGFRELYIIDGKVSMSTKQKLALVRQRGYKVWPDPGNDENSATWYGIRDGITHSSTFTMEDAQRVEARENSKNITLDQKSTYRQFPKRMLSWRAAGYLLDDVYSDVATGIYSPDELGAITDDEGRVIDINEVQPVVMSEQDERKAERDAAKAELAPEDERRELHARIAHLPRDIKEGDDGFNRRWADAGFPKPRDLAVGQLRKAKAMVTGAEARARKEVEGWEPYEPPAEAPESRSPAPEDGERPATTPEGAAAQETEAEVPETGGNEQAEDPEPGSEQPDESPTDEWWPDFPEDADENEQRQVASQHVQAIIIEVNNNALVERVINEVKDLSWQRVNSELVHVHHAPHDLVARLHVDTRRMLLVGRKLTERPY